MHDPPDSPPESLNPVSPFDHHYGLELEHCDARLVRARVPVRPQITQPLGMVHGGVYAAIAETLASMGTNAGVVEHGNVALGQSNACSFLRPISEGAIHATATVRHSGISTWVWDVELHDDHARLCALGRVTVAVRRRPRVAPAE